MKILLIGFGGIGRRHYESLISDKNVTVYIHDLTIDLAIPEEYQKRTFILDEKLLMKEKIFDLLILATSANVRAELLQRLISSIEFGKIIIEKPIAQSIKELTVLKNIDENIPMYVNFPQRYYPIYKELKNMNMSSNFEIKVNGYGWGMACNLWHFVDLIGYLTNAKLEKILWPSVKWVHSKRLGFEEIEGECVMRFSNNTNLRLKSTHVKNEPLIVNIINGDNLEITIKDYYFLYSSIDRFSIGEKVDVYQSELTLKYLDSNSLRLPRISDVYDSTLIILKSIMMIKYGSFTDDTKVPIT